MYVYTYIYIYIYINVLLRPHLLSGSLIAQGPINPLACLWFKLLYDTMDTSIQWILLTYTIQWILLYYTMDTILYYTILYYTILYKHPLVCLWFKLICPSR